MEHTLLEYSGSCNNVKSFSVINPIVHRCIAEI